jgi:replicative DNA helicase
LDLKLPPQNLEAERAVIGSILIDNDSIEKVIDMLVPDHFYDPKHAILYEAIVSLYTHGSPVDVLTLTAELKKTKRFKQVGGAIYLSELISSVPSASNIEYYGQIVKEMGVRRNLIGYSTKLGDKARQENESLDEILNELESNIMNLTSSNSRNDYYDAPTLLEMQMKLADEYARNPDGLRGMPTGVSKLDNYLGGLHKGDLIIIAARPSVGKSTLAFNIARHAAVESKKTVLIFSVEMPAVQVMQRILAAEMQADLWNIRMGKLTEEEYKRNAKAMGKIGDSKLYIDETPGVNLMQLRSKARKLMLDKGLDLIIVDYLQLMQTRETDNRATAIGEISRGLKILARELNIPVIVLSQLNRAVENRSDRIPQLSDLRESGSIEQDADIVIFLSKEMVAEVEDKDEPIKIDVVIAKHRNGAVGKFELKFIGPQQRYEDI